MLGGLASAADASMAIRLPILVAVLTISALVIRSSRRQREA
jgi:hypothetical protein